MLSGQTPERVWNTRRTEKQRRLASVPVKGKVLPTDDLVAMLEKLIAPGDKVVLEGNNQKQADFLSRALASVNPQKVHDLHMIMPSVGRSEHLDIFEKGIARKLDFSLLRYPKPAYLAVAGRWPAGNRRYSYLHRAVFPPVC
jgi:malonate decarboxylase alpha subunit